MRYVETIIGAVVLALSIGAAVGTNESSQERQTRECEMVLPVAGLDAGDGSFFCNALPNAGVPADVPPFTLCAYAMTPGHYVDAGGDVDRRAWHERQWADWYASTMPPEDDAKVEHVLPCGARVDILTTTTAFEMDYAGKWAEGIGQALYYAAATGRRPGLVLLLQRGDDNDRRDYLRALVCAHHAGITLIAVQIPSNKVRCSLQNRGQNVLTEGPKAVPSQHVTPHPD